jgi:hypothetical protein
MSHSDDGHGREGSYGTLGSAPATLEVVVGAPDATWATFHPATTVDSLPVRGSSESSLSLFLNDPDAKLKKDLMVPILKGRR